MLAVPINPGKWSSTVSSLQYVYLLQICKPYLSDPLRNDSKHRIDLIIKDAETNLLDT
jgi:hypothetical protein